MPAELPGAGMEPALYVGAGGQVYPQIQPAAGSAQSEQVVSRDQKGKVNLTGTQQGAGLLLAAGAAKQTYPVPGTAAAADHPQGA